ncbi:MAG: phenylalanine--tRNA ligase beta subunit-related protein, partial [Planctomycetota bacterium]
PDTTALLLEAANFDAATVRRTAMRMGLRTEASSRFEKALDPEAAWAAARRFTEFVLEHCPGARVACTVTDAYPRPLPARRIELPYDLVGRRLGLRVGDGDIRRNLDLLGFGVREEGSRLVVDVPSWRATKDVTCSADLVEEVGRIRGYDDVPVMPPVGSLTPTRPSPLRRLERSLAALLSLDLGYAETKTYAFYGPTDVERLGLEDFAHLEVVSPIAREQDRLAVTAVANLLRAVARNVAHEATGRLWEPTRLVAPSAGGDDPALEVRTLALLTWDRDGEADASGRLFRDLMEDLRAVLAGVPVDCVGVEDAGEVALVPGLPAAVWLHPGRRGLLRAGDEILAVAGEVAPAVLRAYGLPGRVAVAEVALESVLAHRGERGSGYRPLHRYPVVPFDVAVLVPRRTPAARVAEVIRGVDVRAIRNVCVFDVYEGDGIPEGRRSLAWRLELLDPSGTLTPKKANRLRVGMRAALEREGWTVRAGEEGGRPAPGPGRRSRSRTGDASRPGGAVLD